MTQGQTKEYAFLIVPDFFVDANLYKYYLLSMEWLICAGPDGIINNMNDNRNLKGNLMIRKLMRKDFDSVFQIIEASFPEDEYRTYDEQKALLDNTAYEVYILKNSDDSTIKAFIAAWEFDSFVFLEHFAVNPTYRNNGIGSEFLRELVRMLGKMVCLEVEPPDNDMASRRIGFYKRNNFFLNKYPYTQPPISAGRNPVPLLIMTYGRYINKMEFSRIKEELITQVYKQQTLVY